VEHYPIHRPCSNPIRRPGRNVQERLLNYFGCAFEDLFEIVLVDPETSDERILQPTGQRPRATKR
jgi:hypothetical protein